MPLALIPARGLFGFRHTSGAVASLASASTLGRRLIWLPSHVWAVTVLAYVTSLGRTFDGFPFLSWTVTLPCKLWTRPALGFRRPLGAPFLQWLP